MLIRIVIGLLLTAVAFAVAGRRVFWLSKLIRVGKPATQGQQARVAGRRRKVMHEMDTVARREDPAKPTSGLDANRFGDMSRVSAKALDDLWQRAIKNSPRADGLRDNNATNQRIVKEIRMRRNPISFDGTEFESSVGDVWEAITPTRSSSAVWTVTS